MIVSACVVVLANILMYLFRHDILDVIPDMAFFYGPEQFYPMIQKMQNSGGGLRYIATAWTLDLLTPVGYSFFLGLAVIRLAKSFSSLVSFLAFVPLLAAVFDCLENLSVTLGIKNLPAISDLLAQAAAAFSTLKWIFVFATLLFVIWRLVVLLLQREKAS